MIALCDNDDCNKKDDDNAIAAQVYIFLMTHKRWNFFNA